MKQLPECLEQHIEHRWISGQLETFFRDLEARVKTNQKKKEDDKNEMLPEFGFKVLNDLAKSAFELVEKKTKHENIPCQKYDEELNKFLIDLQTGLNIQLNNAQHNHETIQQLFMIGVLSSKCRLAHREYEQLYLLELANFLHIKPDWVLAQLESHKNLKDLDEFIKL